MRIRRPPWTTLSYSATSPAAKIPGTEVWRWASTLIPPLSPSSSPAARASITSGIAPVADHDGVGLELVARTW